MRIRQPRLSTTTDGCKYGSMDVWNGLRCFMIRLGTPIWMVTIADELLRLLRDACAQVVSL